MAMGYDVAELLAEIKEKDAQIALLVPNSFTEAEIKLVMSTMYEAHTPERVQREMSSEAASVIRKLQGALDKIEGARRDAADFAPIRQEPAEGRTREYGRGRRRTGRAKSARPAGFRRPARFARLIK